jgi:hypothetical protein
MDDTLEAKFKWLEAGMDKIWEEIKTGQKTSLQTLLTVDKVIGAQEKMTNLLEKLAKEQQRAKKYFAAFDRLMGVLIQKKRITDEEAEAIYGMEE